MFRKLNKLKRKSRNLQTSIDVEVRDNDMIKERKEEKKPFQNSVLSHETQIVGDLKSTEALQINCQLIGNIDAHIITVGANAEVEGNIIADDIVISGIIRGNVTGKKVRLTSTALVLGDITHGVIAIEDGARFEGHVKQQNKLASAS